MKKNFFDTPFFRVGRIFAVIIFCVASFIWWMTSSPKKYKCFVFKDGVRLEVSLTTTLERNFFDFSLKTEEYVDAVKASIHNNSFETVVNNVSKIKNDADSIFEEKTKYKISSTIEILLSKEVEEAMMSQKIAELEFQSTKYQIARDSLISVAAKKDAHGYTPEAERLENRRDQRFNTAEERKLKKATLESNERIETRKAEALEEAASNVGFLSGDVTIIQK